VVRDRAICAVHLLATLGVGRHFCSEKITFILLAKSITIKGTIIANGKPTAKPKPGIFPPRSCMIKARHHVPDPQRPRAIEIEHVEPPNPKIWKQPPCKTGPKCHRDGRLFDGLPCSDFNSEISNRKLTTQALQIQLKINDTERSRCARIDILIERNEM
jgi:hypothetical protein